MIDEDVVQPLLSSQGRVRNVSGDSMTNSGSRITSRQFTSCGSADGGKVIKLGFIDNVGSPVSIEMPFDQAASLVMTLPRLLSAALKLQTGETEARYVFPLGGWKLEVAQDPSLLLLTMRTPDGFEVAFSVPVAVCEAMGQLLAGYTQSNPAGRDSPPLN